jgi:hypothetical protein
LHELGESSDRSHPQRNSIGLEVAVLGLPRVAGHRHGLVTDILDLVDRDGLSERAAGGVVAGEFGSHGAVLRVAKVPKVRYMHSSEEMNAVSPSEP